MIYTIPAFPEQVGEHIPAPNILELLTMPIFARASAEHFKAHCHPFQQLLFDNSPITGRFPFVSVDSYVQAIEPHTCPINIRYEGGWLHEWHNDGVHLMKDVETEYSLFHIYMSKCEARTAYNKYPVTVEIPDDIDHMEFSNMVNQHWEEWGLVPEKADAERILTFREHMHTSTAPPRREFRFFFRVTESHTIESRDDDDSIIAASVVQSIGSQGNIVRQNSVVHNEQGIFLPRIK